MQGASASKDGRSKGGTQRLSLMGQASAVVVVDACCQPCPNRWSVPCVCMRLRLLTANETRATQGLPSAWPLANSCPLMECAARVHKAARGHWEAALDIRPPVTSDDCENPLRTPSHTSIIKWVARPRPPPPSQAPNPHDQRANPAWEPGTGCTPGSPARRTRARELEGHGRPPTPADGRLAPTAHWPLAGPPSSGQWPTPPKRPATGH